MSSKRYISMTCPKVTITVYKRLNSGEQHDLLQQILVLAAANGRAVSIGYIIQLELQYYSQQELLPTRTTAKNFSSY